MRVKVGSNADGSPEMAGEAQRGGESVTEKALTQENIAAQENIIVVQDLTKQFVSANRREGVWGSVKDLFTRERVLVDAVKGISFTVKRGELLGYIGPNGAGKSTSIKMLTGILKPTSGHMSVLGSHPFLNRKQYAKKIGVVFGQRTQLWWDIAVIESFRLLAKIYGVPPDEFEERLKLLDSVLELSSLLRTPVRKLSLGQRVRCDLAASLIHNPPVLFLDEPTIGLDTVTKDAVRGFLREVNSRYGTTILLTTHDLREIEELCERIVILDHGRIIYDGSLDRIKTLPGLTREVIIDFQTEAPEAEFNNLFSGKVSFVKEGSRRLRAKVDPTVIPTVEIIRNALERFQVADIVVGEPGIEEVVMKIYREGIAPASSFAKDS